MRNWTIAAVVATLAFGVWMLTAFSSGVPVAAAKVTRQAIREYIDEEAKTRLANDYLITMPIHGRVESNDLTEGTPVKKGQVVARIVPRDLELSVAAATAAVERLDASIQENDDTRIEETALAQAISFVKSSDRTVEAATARVRSGKAKLDYAEKSLARIEHLRITNARTEDDLDRARVDQVESSVEYQEDVLVQRAMQSIQAATALMPTLVRQYIQRKALTRKVLQKQLAEAQVHVLQTEREQTRGAMASPVDGVVLERLVANERHLAAGTLLMRIGRWEDLEVEADVLTQDAVRIRPGNHVEVRGPAIGPEPVTGRVDRIFPAGFTKISSLGVEQQRVKLIVRLDPRTIETLREQRELGVDYRVRVRVFTAAQEDALVIPRSALFRGTDGHWQVFVIRDGQTALQDVRIGLRNDRAVAVVEGLAEHEVVVLAPESNLAAHQQVEPVFRSSAMPASR